MKTLDFIRANIGATVYLTPDKDLMMWGPTRHIIKHKMPLTLLGLDKGGRAYVQDKATGTYHFVPPSNVRLYSEIAQKPQD